MNRLLPRSVVLKYYVYKAVSSAHLSGPIWVLFLLSREMSYTQVGLLDSVFAATLLLAEIPTGYIGDRIGRRNGLLVSTMLGSIGSIGFAFGFSFGAFAVMYAILAIGRTFRSGTESAWLYDILKERMDESEFARVNGRGNAVGLVVGGTAMIAGGALGRIDLAYPWIVSGVATGFAFMVLLTFPESARYADEEGFEDFTLLNALPTIKARILGSSLRSFVVYVAFFYAIMAGVNYFIQPISTQLGLTVFQLGWLYASFSLVAAVISYYSGEIKDRIGIDRWFRIAPISLGGFFLAVGVAPLLALPMFFVLKAIRNASQPLEQQYLNDNTASTGRATVLSAISMLYALVEIPAQVVIGGLADRYTAEIAIGILGGVLLVVTVIVWIGNASIASSIESSETAD